MPNISSETNLSIISLELKHQKNHPLTLIFDKDPRKYHDFPAAGNTRPGNATFLKYFDLKILSTWLAETSTPLPTNKNPTIK